MVPKKKILYVITKSNFGGAQRYVYELATSLPKETYDVAIACGGNGLLTQKLREVGIPVFEVKSFERDINLAKEFASLFELRNIFKTFRPDIVHLNSSKAGGTGALIARIMGVPNIIFTAHGWAFNEPHNILWRSIVWFLSWVTALLSHTIILVSEYDYKRTRMPWVKKKCHIIRTAVPDIDFLSRDIARSVLFSEEERDLHTHDLWLVSLAELTPNKNLVTAIKAVGTYNRKHQTKIFYSIIGDGELRHELETLITKEGLTDSVKLLGYVVEARGLLKAFDMHILPSLKEGMPYAIIEAGAAGLPTIASNVGGIPEIIDDSISGLLIDPRSVENITDALHELVTNKIKRDSLAKNLKTKIDTDFTLEKMLEKTLATYSQHKTL